MTLHHQFIIFWRKSLMAITQECCELSWTSPGGSNSQNNRCTATYNLSRKLSNLYEPDMQDTAGEIRTSLFAIYSCWLLPMDKQREDDQLEPIYNSSVPILDVALEDLSRAMNDRDGWREKVREIRAGSATWWWLLYKLISYV